MCRLMLTMELELEVVDEAELLVLRLIDVTVSTPLVGCILGAALVRAMAEEVGECGDNICSGVRLPSEPSLDSDEGGVKGRP